MKSRRIWFSLILLVTAAAPIILLWGTSLPLGIPGEWVWQRLIIDDTEWPDFLLGSLVAAACLALYIIFVRLGFRRLQYCSRKETCCWLTLLVIATFGWLMVVQAPPPFDSPMAKAAWVPYYPKFSGYYTVARHDMPDLETFLGTYEERMAEGDVLHIGTHPPGMFLFHRGLLAICHSNFGLTQFLMSTQPEVVQTAFGVTSDYHTRRWGQPFSDEDQAAVWLSSLVTQFVAALTVIPLFLLLRRDYSRVVSWMTVSFWPFIPAISIFLPKSDALFPFFGISFLFVWLEGEKRSSAIWCVFAGFLFWLSMFFSLAILPVGLLAALLTLWNSYNRLRDQPKQAIKKIGTAVAWAAGGFLGMVIVFWLVYDLNLFQVWGWNYKNHAGFYGQTPRTYWKWLLINPVELVFAAGTPVIVLVVSSFINWVQKDDKGDRSKHLIGNPSFGPIVCCAIVGGILLLSGKNQGEAGRLWIIFLPWLIWLSAEIFQRLSGSSKSPNGKQSEGVQTSDAALINQGQNCWIALLMFQAIVCFATVMRVDGFELHHSSPATQLQNFPAATGE